MTRLLLVEDDRNFADGLRYNLERAGYGVELARTGEEGLALALAGGYALILLDLMLPNVDGYEILEALRRAQDATPVIILSARDEDIDKVRGFDLGADDYVSKPFGVGELLARIRARLPGSATDVEAFPLGDGVVRLTRLVYERDGAHTALTPTEADLLRVLHASGGDPVGRESLLREVWGVERVRTRTLDTHITRLRKKLEPDPSRPRHLLTVHGVGYRLVGSAGP